MIKLVMAIQKRDIFNQAINFFWSILCLVPIFWFWFKEGINNIYFRLFLGIALIIGLLPRSILNLLTFSSQRNFYERLGVKFIRKFVQNGDAVNSLNHTKGIANAKGKKHFRTYTKTIAMYERYHWICLTFFLLTTLYCFAYGYVKFGILISIANTLYNFCPILLQQYNKLRIKKLFND
ncbi:glycosyl-4,4'-diaponeurosporenoate acyltransferase CrtO family protein [Niabella aquatica]